MTRDDVIRMARESGLFVGTNMSGVMLVGHEYLSGGVLTHLTVEDVQRFAALVAGAEREECAKVCDGYAWGVGGAAKRCASAIRARGGE